MEISPNKAVEFIIKQSSIFAAAKANRTYIENYLRSVKSKLMGNEEGTLGAKEAYAYAHNDYIEQLTALRIATEEEERLKYMMSAAQLRVDVWKTNEYTKRAELKNL
jgi:RNA-splicing ligase RtcB